MPLNHRKPTVVVLEGGPDAERDGSLMSGRDVAQALRATRRFDVVEQEIGTPGAGRIRIRHL